MNIKHILYILSICVALTLFKDISTRFLNSYEQIEKRKATIEVYKAVTGYCNGNGVANLEIGTFKCIKTN